ncbi:MAG: glycosyltransferase family 2 protein [Armatimonadetes bacterium]|nr:glycosyltransferase family 2 protein [Armatimonadota bacterium]MDE2205765.1 glycosyltransferase family 2 protein [Armatimonadota bacterium]
MCEEKLGATRLSIAIVNWNTRELLMQALGSIISAPPQGGCDIIVVDNASSDGSADAVAAGFPEVRLVANATNVGYAAGNNQALALARSPYTLLLNPDVIVPPGALDVALARMERHPKCGALGVRLVHPNGEVQRSVRGFPRPVALLCEMTGLAAVFSNSRWIAAYRMPWFNYSHEAEVDQPMGTFLLLRTEVAAEVGPMDEAFPIFFNEVDWLYRCKQRGWSVWFTPDVEIVHYGGASTSQVGAKMAWESHYGLMHYYRKHYGGALHAPVRWLIGAASWLRAAVLANRRARISRTS